MSKFVVLEDGAGSTTSSNNVVGAYLHNAILLHYICLFLQAELAPNVLVSEQFLPSHKICQQRSPSLSDASGSFAMPLLTNFQHSLKQNCSVTQMHINV